MVAAASYECNAKPDSATDAVAEPTNGYANIWPVSGLPDRAVSAAGYAI